MGQPTFIRKSDAVVKGKITLPTAGDKQVFLMCSDIHLDNPKCKRKLFKKHLTQAKEIGAKVMIFGDLFCAMQGVKDRRGSKSQLKASQLEGPYFDNIVEDAYNFLKPFKEQIALITYGNHETAIIKHNEIDLLKNLVYRLNSEPGDDILIGGYGGWVRLTISTQQTVTKSFDIKYFHGSGGNSPVTKGAIQMQRKAAECDADIVLMGHNHQRQQTSFMRERLNKSGKLCIYEQVHLRMPTYKDAYGDGTKGWEVEKGFGASPLGGWWLEFTAVNKEVAEYTYYPAK